MTFRDILLPDRFLQKNSVDEDFCKYMKSQKRIYKESIQHNMSEKTAQNQKTTFIKALQSADNFFANRLQACFCFFTPGRILLFAGLFFLIHAYISLCLNQQIYRDVAGVYAWYAKEFGNGIWWDIPLSKVPVLNIFLGGLMVRCGIEPYTSLIILSLFFMVLTMLPLFGLLKLFLPAQKAAWGCVLFMLAPKLLRFSGSGLLESTRDFFLVSALYLLFKSWNDQCKWYHWIFMGLSLGLLSLARGEGIAMAGVLAAGILFRSLKDWKSIRTFCKNILLPIIITGIFSIGVMLPVLVQNYKVTGFPVTDSRLIGVLRAVPGVSKIFELKEHHIKNDPRILPHTDEKATGKKMGNGTLERLRDFPGNVFRGAYEIYFVLAILGMILLIREKKWRKEYSFLAGYCLLVACSFINFSVAHRYFIFFVPLLMVFTLYALNDLFNMAEKYHVKNILIVLFAVVFLLQPLNAWSWMIGESSNEELALREFIEQNRHRFLPEGGSGKLIIHGDSRYLFRCGEDRLFHYGEKIPKIRYITGFDLLFIRKKDQQDLAVCLERKDLRQIETSFRNFVIFAPIERLKK